MLISIGKETYLKADIKVQDWLPEQQEVTQQSLMARGMGVAASLLLFIDVQISFISGKPSFPFQKVFFVNTTKNSSFISQGYLFS